MIPAEEDVLMDVVRQLALRKLTLSQVFGNPPFADAGG